MEGHVLPNPVDTESYMVMLCYKNGSLAREGNIFISADSRKGLVPKVIFLSMNYILGRYTQSLC